MRYRFEITLLLVCVVVCVCSTTGYFLFMKKVALEQRKARLKTVVFKKARIGLTDQEMKFMLRGMMAKSISFHITCRENVCHLTLSSNSVDYPSAMDALLRISQVFDCGAKSLCMGIGCKIPFRAEVSIYARKYNP